MKLSDIFPLPLDTSVPAGEVLAFETYGRAAVATVHAINHHDALVKALQALVDVKQRDYKRREDTRRAALDVLDEVRKDGR